MGKLTLQPIKVLDLLFHVLFVLALLLIVQTPFVLLISMIAALPLLVQVIFFPAHRFVYTYM